MTPGIQAQLAKKTFKVFQQNATLEAQPQTFTALSGRKSVFTITRQPTHGTITNFDINTGRFKYTPATKYIGDDAFYYSEAEEGVREPHPATITITVLMSDKYPVIITETVGFEMNTTAVGFSLAVRDYHDPVPQAFLSANAVKETATGHGILKHIGANQFSYTPTRNYRGRDQFEFFARNSFGKTSKKIVTLKSFRVY